MEVRTGKTLTALNTAELFGSKSVLFLTKKKAIEGVKKDFETFGFTFDLEVWNDESLHKKTGDFDLVIHDEHHRFGSFPTPSKRAKLFKTKFSNLPMIVLSGTPFAESYSQVYHQFFVSDYNPFKYDTFYEFHKNQNLPEVYQKINGYDKKDYSAKRINLKNYYRYNFLYKLIKNDPFYLEKKIEIIQNFKRDLIKIVKYEERIEKFIEPYLIKYTQKKAGFASKIRETVLFCDMQPSTLNLVKKLKKDLVYESGENVILADTGVKLMQKLHQIWSGTVKTEDGEGIVFDFSKARFIQENFKFKKIAIFYKFKAELKMLQDFFGSKLTTDLEDFNTTDKWIALQIVSGREGISLRNADCLVFMNIDFSAVSYWQARDRLTTKDRLENEVYWIFAHGGIEHKIYKTVIQKKDFNLRVFNMLKD